MWILDLAIHALAIALLPIMVLALGLQIRDIYREWLRTEREEW